MLFGADNNKDFSMKSHCARVIAGGLWMKDIRFGISYISPHPNIEVVDEKPLCQGYRGWVGGEGY
jgi:hypothetical protein